MNAEMETEMLAIHKEGLRLMEADLQEERETCARCGQMLLWEYFEDEMVGRCPSNCEGGC